jgi:hypothetical protein
MRQLKHHEKKLLKKVDFLDVSAAADVFLPSTTTSPAHFVMDTRT